MGSGNERGGETQMPDHSYWSGAEVTSQAVDLMLVDHARPLALAEVHLRPLLDGETEVLNVVGVELGPEGRLVIVAR